MSLLLEALVSFRAGSEAVPEENDRSNSADQCLTRVPSDQKDGLGMKI